MKVVLADGHPLLRLGVRTALRREEDLQVVAEAGTGDEALQAVLKHRPDLLILEIVMAGLPCRELLLQAHRAVPGLRTLILTEHDDDAYVKQMVQVPISGYLLKDEAPEHLLQAVRVLAQGAVWFSQSVAGKLMGLPTDVEPPGRATFQLTPRELQILQLLSRGENNRGIARELSLAEQTVRNYLSTLYDKLGVTTRATAVVWAHARGIR